MRITLAAAHLGYSPERSPLGGGAAVAVGLSRAWAGDARFSLSLIGSGPFPPDGATYLRAAGRDAELTSLSELAYARFCREFEAETTARLLEARPEAAVVNDVSESPDLSRLKAAGIRIVSIWHVDVADFFCRMYLRGLPTPAAVRAWEALRPLRFLSPDVLRLVFEKTRDSVMHSDLLVVPSEGVRSTLLRCWSRFSPGLESRVISEPWGALASPAGEPADIRARFGLAPGTRVLMTLSRISPEKGLGRVIESLRALEDAGAGSVALFVCGAPAYMGGRREEARLKRLASTLKRTKVFFPGHAGDADKRAFFAAADLLISASLHESYGLAAAEALSAGVPIVAAANLGMKEVLRRGGGVLVPEGRGFSGRLAAALMALLEDEPRRRQLSEQARASVEPFGSAAARLADELALLLRRRPPVGQSV
jgi:glycosyltransferase involved in cell wall biosynthesis